jgi:ABC-type transport system substrate-binding protein
MRRKTTLFVLAFMVSAMAFSVVPAVSAQEVELHPFIYAAGSSPVGIDPLGVYDTSSGLILTNVLEGLFKFDYSDPSMPSVPLLAADMGEWNTDQTEWTVDLVDDVLWHDGTPFTADDVVWNFDRLNYMAETGMCDHDTLWFNDDWVNQSANEHELILDEIIAVDSNTVKFVLNKAWLDFEALLPFWGCSMIKPTNQFATELLTFEDIGFMIGTGPYMLESVTINEKSVLLRNENYWRDVGDFQQIVIQVFDASSAENALFNEEVYLIRSLTTESIPIVEQKPKISYEKVKSACCYGYHLGMNMPWHARKAMQFAFNYTYMTETMNEGYSFEIHTPVPDGMYGHNAGLAGLPVYDLDIARGYLLQADSPYLADLTTAGIDAESDNADWIDLASTTPIDTFNFTCYSNVAGFQPILDDFFSYIGIKIKLNNRGDWSTFLHYCDDTPNLDIVMLGWCPDYFAAVNQIEPLFATGASSNWNRLANSTVDAAISALHTIPQGPALLAKIDEVVSMVIVENAAAMYYEQSAEYIAYSNWYLDEDSTDDLWNAQLDKYFYNLEWNNLNVPESWSALTGATVTWSTEETETTTTTAGIPGYAPGILMAVAAAGFAFLLLRKRK